VTKEHRNETEEKNASATGALRTAWKQISMTLRARARLRRQQTARARAQQLKYVTREQLAYADVLEVALSFGRYLLTGTFVLYVFGVTSPRVPLSELTGHWSLPAEQYSSLVGFDTGWSWIKLVHYGDYMNFLGIAFLASVTAVCCLRLLPISLRSKDHSFSTILVLQILVLFLAASGLLALGH
jgi:hypothetical protein